VIADGRIAGVGCYEWRASQTLSASGHVILPGLIDAHMHVESTLLTPFELARLIVPMGTTAVISDSHEVANVLGVPGIDMLAEAGVGLPLDLFYMASSCVPATEWEDAGAVLGPTEVHALLSRPHVLGLAEVMDIPGVLGAGHDILEKIRAALEARTVVDGHAPALAGRELIAYVAAGIRSDHTGCSIAEGRARLPRRPGPGRGPRGLPSRRRVQGRAARGPRRPVPGPRFRPSARSQEHHPLAPFG